MGTRSTGISVPVSAPFPGHLNPYRWGEETGAPGYPGAEGAEGGGEGEHRRDDAAQRPHVRLHAGRGAW